jgi:hypothetical protein
MRLPKVVLLLAIFLLAGRLPIFAQLASDPNDRMYTDLKLWEDRGILRNLPQLKPFPIQLLKKLLSDVQQKGDADEAARAADYFSEMDGIIDIHPGFAVEARTDLKSVYGAFTFGGPFQGSLDPSVTYSGYLAGVANNGPGESLLPEYTRNPTDYIFDSGVKPLGTTSFIPRVSSASAGALGSDTFYFQGGDIRGSWGPFWGENVVLSPSSPQTGQFSYAYRGESFTATEAIMTLSARDSTGAGGPFPNKFLALHGLELYPLPWLTVGIFESVVWGGRFEFLYLLPFAAHYYTQGFAGFPDNSFIGLSGSIKLPEAVRVDFLAYFDDMSFNDLIKLNFNTRMKFAFQTGVSWTPNYRYLARLAFEAMVVTPYTYTHSDNTADPTKPNYLDYTNSGQNIGPSLQPDSARLEISALVRPDPVVDVKAFARALFHGNASSDPGFTGPGTIFDNGSGPPVAFDTFRFLTQAVIEQTFQAGFNAKAYFSTPIGKVQVYADYTFEYILNKDNGSGPVAGPAEVNNYFGAGCRLSF